MDLFELSAKIELETDEYEKSVKDASKTAEKVEDSLKDAGKAADKAEESIDDLGDTAKKTSKETSGLGDSVDKSKDSFLGSIVKADLFADALEKVGEIAMEVVQYIWGLDEATEEYRASQAKLNTAFKVSGFNANTARDAFKGLYRAVGDIDQATEAAQLLSQLALTTEDVSKWTEIATGVVGTFGDSLPIESLIESANETARVGKVTGTLADALNWAGQIGEDEFNTMLADCGTQAERVNLITETLLGTYSEAAKSFEEASGATMEARDAFLEIQNASAKAGESVEKLKGSLAVKGSFAAQGFFGFVSEIIDKLAGVTKKSAEANLKYKGFVDSIRTRIETGSVEEATEAFYELSDAINAIESGDWNVLDRIHKDLGSMSAVLGFQDELGELLGVAQNRFAGTGEAAELAATQEERYAAASADVVEAMEPIIATADGVSVAIEGTSMTAEEASSRLQTYTDAALNFMSQISTESELSYSGLVENLQHNFEAVNDFANNMQSLAGVLPPAMYETFAAGGPQMYAGVVAMLAEANTGANEGLPELQRLFENGGDAALKAFIASLGKVPEGTENPATITAAQMEQDTSMEAASVSAVERASSAMSEAVSSAGFDASGRLAMQLFGNGMESMRSYVMSIARDIANAARDEINGALGGIGGGRGGGRAGGLDYVPYNGYPAVLHAGEAVLTAREAKEWRSGKSGTSNGVTINQYITAVPQTPAQFAAATQAYFSEAVWAL